MSLEDNLSILEMVMLYGMTLFGIVLLIIFMIRSRKADLLRKKMIHQNIECYRKIRKRSMVYSFKPLKMEYWCPKKPKNNLEKAVERNRNHG